jgi:hypothetical protein
MFQSHDEAADYHAAARAVSGGPVYFTDEPGKERPEILKRLAFSDDRLLLADEPAQVTRDLLLSDPSIEPVSLKVFARVTRPGLSAGVVAAFHVNKGAPRVVGVPRVQGAPPSEQGRQLRKDRRQTRELEPMLPRGARDDAAGRGQVVRAHEELERRAAFVERDAQRGFLFQQISEALCIQ